MGETGTTKSAESARPVTLRRPPTVGEPRAMTGGVSAPGARPSRWLVEAWLRAVVVTAVVAGAAAGGAVIGATREGPLERVTLAALIAGTMMGFLVSAIMILHPARRAAEGRRWLVNTLGSLARHNRKVQFASLLDTRAHDEALEVAEACHGALLSAHRDRLQAATLRKEMDHRVERETRHAVAHLSKATMTDDLTGLLNRRGFEAALQQVWNDTAPTGEEISLLAIDLDLFKQLNDACGHEKGDEALRAAGELLAAHLRGNGDFAARVGGDELFVLLRGIGSSAARAAAERVMSLFATHPAGSGLPVDWPTMSVGIASASEHMASDPEDLKRKADAALYASKRSGRSQCTVYNPTCDSRPSMGGSVGLQRAPRADAA